MFIELVLIHARARTHTHIHSSLELNSSVGTGFSKWRYEHVSICAHISEEQIMIKCVCVSPSMCLSRSEEQLEREGNKFDDTCSSHPHPHHHHVHIDDNWLSKWSHQTNRTYVLSLVTARVYVINYLSLHVPVAGIFVWLVNVGVEVFFFVVLLVVVVGNRFLVRINWWTGPSLGLGVVEKRITAEEMMTSEWRWFGICIWIEIY